ncbi:hypothetical protein Tco_0066097 [Tanacetum coccineum]
MSRMDDDLFTYEVEIPGLASVPCDLNEEDDLEQHMTHGSNDDMEYDPSNTRGDDEVKPTKEESFDSDDDDEIAEIFRIDTNVFDFETATCRTFKELNYLLQIDPDVLTNNIDGFKTYKEYKDDWIYEWNEDIPWVNENHKQTMNWKDDGYCNGGNFPGAYIVGNTLRYENLECYENTIHNHKERQIGEEHENKERCELFNIPHHETPVCKIQIFEMIKYSFGQDEEYVAIKECEYEDLTITNEDACRAYQEIFCSMDEGWMVLAGKEIDKVREVSII